MPTSPTGSEASLTANLLRPASLLQKLQTTREMESYLGAAWARVWLVMCSVEMARRKTFREERAGRRGSSA